MKLLAATLAIFIFSGSPVTKAQGPAGIPPSTASGVVRLHAVIARDGTIKALEVVSGDSLLTQAALDAGKQWRYRPTVLNGETVEVDTVVDIIFNL